MSFRLPDGTVAEPEIAVAIRPSRLLSHRAKTAKVPDPAGLAKASDVAVQPVVPAKAEAELIVCRPELVAGSKCGSTAQPPPTMCVLPRQVDVPLAVLADGNAPVTKVDSATGFRLFPAAAGAATRVSTVNATRATPAARASVPSLLLPDFPLTPRS